MSYIYETIKEALVNRIQEGVYKPFEKIPSERKLAEEFKTSRVTIRQAITALEKEGYVNCQKGRGAFVASHQFAQLNLRSFTETVKSQGYEAGTEVLENTVVHHLKDIAELMKVDVQTKFYKIKRLRQGDDVPIAYETVYIPTEKCPDINEKDLTGSLYNILSSDYNIEVESASYDIDATVANSILMRDFKVDKKIALLKINGVSYDIAGQSVMYEQSYYRSDLYHYKVDIYKRGN